MVVIPVDWTVEESKKFIELCYKAQRQFNTDSDEVRTLISLTNYSQHFVKEFSAGGFFKINNKLFFVVLGNVATYYIIAIQFHQSQNSSKI